ncbi:hypothetical protein GLOIN_2v1545951 [Rhizophagus irregularis DAOM 181602=DAOM 197198]|uniref:Uncharacterized protein n=1 Tax=Rhizophagus irregularis (strain DAOM 181602 / DAOM 197198 / MUCL 43194) TaxID=747089 RepID=A0A2P4QIW6_RHIID|nr:hypothetical protein GLOIN_2v1545951 [Rhizophagus irregularis DAOM 181602=DAOM 197198]POG77597.1 hypothetical protein GLOIN_2v1545951 [Rhizophagus irregularis DAOM 181602=DAOM 197198]GET54462.1 hypothetical protein GLOIN_2v1545951 [Rhizophagus irregularis DAOM 181602=DAOM 197198]|eukprot:XP_025184463.1 hypothetical protein GLOIN_2v1545951 [Rhizophagus irregularis DAOM 181602=DAOM 197198]
MQLQGYPGLIDINSCDNYSLAHWLFLHVPIACDIIFKPIYLFSIIADQNKNILFYKLCRIFFCFLSFIFDLTIIVLSLTKDITWFIFSQSFVSSYYIIRIFF